MQAHSISEIPRHPPRNTRCTRHWSLNTGVDDTALFLYSILGTSVPHFIKVIVFPW